MQPELGISSLSLGSCEHHSLSSKLRAAARAGFIAIDLFDNDWEHFKRHHANANNLPLSSIDGDETSISAARAVNRMCTSHNIRILCLQPFRDFEGRKDPQDAAERMRQARGTISILPLLGTTMLLIPSTTLPPTKVDADPRRMAADLAQLADHAASYSPPIRICYEALAWGTHVSTWKDAWDVIQLANRRNLGLCLDSFNTIAREWADPYQPTGVRDANVGYTLRRSLRNLVDSVPADKIFYFQLADGQRMLKPLTPPEDPAVPLLRPWSRSYRLFPLEVERGAYLPVREFAEAVRRTGYKGSWCLEVFNDSLSDSGPIVPDEHARRGIVSLRHVLHVVNSQSKNDVVDVVQTHLLSTKPQSRSIKNIYGFLLASLIASSFLLFYKSFQFSMSAFMRYFSNFHS